MPKEKFEKKIVKGNSVAQNFLVNHKEKIRKKSWIFLSISRIFSVEIFHMIQRQTERQTQFRIYYLDVCEWEMGVNYYKSALK